MFCCASMYEIRADTTQTHSFLRRIFALNVLKKDVVGDEQEFVNSSHFIANSRKTLISVCMRSFGSLLEGSPSIFKKSVSSNSFKSGFSCVSCMGPRSSFALCCIGPHCGSRTRGPVTGLERNRGNLEAHRAIWGH